MENESLHATAALSGHVPESRCGRPKKYHMVGERYGWLVVEEELPALRVGRNSYRMALCRCGCGRMKICRYVDLRRGSVTSCGCLARHIRRFPQRKQSA